MHEMHFSELIHTLDKEDGISLVLLEILEKFHEWDCHLTLAQCTIIDRPTRHTRIWLLCDEVVTSAEQVAAVTSKLRSTANHMTAGTAQQMITVDTDADVKVTYLFLFMTLLELGYLSYQDFQHELYVHNIYIPN